MSKLGLVVILLSACATTTGTLEREPAPRARVQLDLAPAAADHARVFPAAIEPRVPSVDRIHRDVRAQLGDEVVAAIDLCVTADGRVTKVALAQGTTFAAFDDALVRDAAQWRFAALPGHTTAVRLQTCERATVKYLAPR